MQGAGSTPVVERPLLNNEYPTNKPRGSNTIDESLYLCLLQLILKCRTKIIIESIWKMHTLFHIPKQKDLKSPLAAVEIWNKNHHRQHLDFAAALLHILKPNEQI
ncbi:hypothetical protein CEXT_149751 [Caerostris extrusa]|uniref:Uncharacterized protein n=1 Tax=Caerostris extrusa TaxID=172846 RepID=A0AAV4QW74_CAEEX|nr:hypothetical protein CEXT_149751 [Caerostris extrusa]